MKTGKIHKLAASLYKPRGSKCRNKVAAYSPEITVQFLCVKPYSCDGNRKFWAKFINADR